MMDGFFSKKDARRISVCFLATILFMVTFLPHVYANDDTFVKIQEMVNDLGGPKYQKQNNGRLQKCADGGTKKITISGGTYKGEYNNCREYGTMRSGNVMISVGGGGEPAPVPKKLTTRQEKAQKYFEQGNASRVLGNYAQAIKDYDKAIELDPRDAVAYDNRGYAYGHLGNYAQAIKDYDKAVELNPTYAAAYNDRGYVYSNLGNYAQAIKDFDRAIELNPKDAAAWTCLRRPWQLRPGHQGL